MSRLVLDRTELKGAAFTVGGATAIHDYAGQFKNPKVLLQIEDFLCSALDSPFARDHPQPESNL
ncbi:MAG: hypothetical protein R3C68_15140 [Myxococcota bacterium]